MMTEKDVRVLMARENRNDLKREDLTPWVEASKDFSKGQIKLCMSHLVSFGELISLKWVDRPKSMLATSFSGHRVIEMCYRYNGRDLRATFPPKGRGKVKQA